MNGAAGNLIQVAMMTPGKSRRAIYALFKVIIVDFDSCFSVLPPDNRAACFLGSIDPRLKKSF